MANTVELSNHSHRQLVHIFFAIFGCLAIFACMDYGFSVFFEPHFYKHFAFLINEITFCIASFAVMWFLNRFYPLSISPRTSIKALCWYIILSAIINTLNIGYFEWLGLIRLSNATQPSLLIPDRYYLFNNSSIMMKVMYILVVIVFGPFFEELFFRGFLYRIIRTRYNIFWGLCVSAGLFSVVHNITGIRIDIVVSSLLMVYVYEKTGNIWSSIILHVLANAQWFAFSQHVARMFPKVVQ